LEALAALVEDEEESVRLVAVRVLGRLAARHEKASAKLVALLEAQDDAMRAAAAEAIGFMEEDGRRLIPVVLRMLGDPSLDVRIGAAAGLAHLGAEDLAYSIDFVSGGGDRVSLRFDLVTGTDFDELHFLLTDDEWLAEEILKVLGGLVTEPPEVTLRDSLFSTDTDEQECARILIRAIPKERLVAEAVLRDPFFDPEALRPRPPDLVAIRHLVHQLGDEAESVRGAAADRLPRFGPAAIAYLERALGSRNERRRAGAQALLKRRWTFWADAKRGAGIDVKTGLPRAVVDRRTGIELVLVPAGTFMMGTSPGDKEVRSGDDNLAEERPARRAAIESAFYLGKYEVTNAQWFAVMKLRTSTEPPDGPVTGVSWDDVQSFLVRTGLRLPTGAEWEYACRAGTTASRYGPLREIAMPLGKVGRGKPNAFGLHDMIGHVWEWCADERGVVPRKDWKFLVPEGTLRPQYRTVRGGGWMNQKSYWLRASVRPSVSPWYRKPDLGFRVARAP
jgi:formylglycine-generating enzyme required for sulfatase activity